VILRDRDFPRLSPAQPRERLRYGYMLFLSNFNGSWEQYVDSFATAIPSGLNLLWFKNVAWPTAIPEQPFHRYVEFNQIWTDYYYNTYPLAASNDVKSAQLVKEKLCTFIGRTEQVAPEEFLREYHLLLKDVQGDLGLLAATPIVSLAAEDISARRAHPGVAHPPRPLPVLDSQAQHAHAPMNDNVTPALRKASGARSEQDNAE
jgi:hypothetical protein